LADLKTALSLCRTDSEEGVTREEFKKISLWVSQKDLSKHVVDVLFALLDENEDHKVSVKELQPVLFQYRSSRGFQKAPLHLTLGSMEI